MRLAIGIFALCGSAAAQTGSVKPLSTQLDRAISVHTQSGSIVIPARELLLEGTFPDGKPLLGNVLLFFDPASGFYLWVCSTYIAPFELRGISGRLPEHKLYLLSSLERYPGSEVVHLGPGGMVAFGTVAVDLQVRQSNQKAMNIDDAESRAIREMSGQLQFLEGHRPYGWTSIRLSSKLGRDFFAPKDSSAVGGFTITDVSRKSDGWELILKGQWKERLTLTNSLDIVKTEKLD